MDMVAAYADVGTYRGVAHLCGTTPKTVKRVVQRHRHSDAARERAERGHNYDAVRDIVAERVRKTNARISAKRLLPEARAAGYAGSARNFRRLWPRPSRRGVRRTIVVAGRGCGRRERR